MPGFVGRDFNRSAVDVNNFSEVLAKTDPNSRRKPPRAEDLDVDVWHRRLGHMNFYYLAKLKNFAADGIKFQEKGLPQCEICSKGKMVRKPFPPSNS